MLAYFALPFLESFTAKESGDILTVLFCPSLEKQLMDYAHPSNVTSQREKHPPIAFLNSGVRGAEEQTHFNTWPD